MSRPIAVLVDRMHRVANNDTQIDIPGLDRHHEIGDIAAARHAWENGVLAARRNGDVQAEKEMNVFLRRLARTSTP